VPGVKKSVKGTDQPKNKLAPPNVPEREKRERRLGNKLSRKKQQRTN